MSPYHKIADGGESQFGVDFLANFLLMKLQLPKLQSAGPSSSIIVIIIVASAAVRRGTTNFNDVNYSLSTSPWLTILWSLYTNSLTNYDQRMAKCRLEDVVLRGTQRSDNLNLCLRLKQGTRWPVSAETAQIFFLQIYNSSLGLEYVDWLWYTSISTLNYTWV